jgi:hypothetical protein
MSSNGSVKNSITIEDFEAIEADIRRRMNDLDQQYRPYFEARQKLEAELAEFQKQKRAMLDFVRKHRSRRGADAIPPSAPQDAAHGAPKAQPPVAAKSTATTAPTEPISKLPWGYDFGQNKVLYVVEQAGRKGLSRREIVDRIAEISGHREALTSVTVWLNRLKNAGSVRNRKRRWYAIKQREDAP